MDRAPDAFREATLDGGLRGEGEDDRGARVCRVGQDRQPYLLAQTDERLAGEGEHGRQQVDDEVVVKDGIAELCRQRAGGCELAGGRFAVEEDDVHTRHFGRSQLLPLGPSEATIWSRK